MSYVERREARNIRLLPPHGWTRPVLNGALGAQTVHVGAAHTRANAWLCGAYHLQDVNQRPVRPFAQGL